MSSAFSFQGHLCDVFKVTYLISFDTIHYHLDSSLAHYLHRAPSPTLKRNNKRGFLSLACISQLLNACIGADLFTFFSFSSTYGTTLPHVLVIYFILFFSRDNYIFYILLWLILFSFFFLQLKKSLTWIVHDFQRRYEFGHFPCARRSFSTRKP